jgi:hypothetical protein
VDETAADQIGTREYLAGPGVDGDDADQDAVLGEVPAIPQHHRAHVADSQTVDQHEAGTNSVSPGDRTALEFEDVAVLYDDDLRGGNAGPLGDLGMGCKMAEFSIDRNEIVGRDEPRHLFQLFGGGVARDMNRSGFPGVNVGSRLVELVDDPVHGRLVARYGARRKHHGVTTLELNGLVLARRNEGQRRQWLPL